VRRNWQGGRVAHRLKIPYSGVTRQQPLADDNSGDGGLSDIDCMCLRSSDQRPVRALSELV
jgi:hypothetical protein